MDRVPNCFIKEVLVQLDYERECWFGWSRRLRELPLIWGQIANSKPFKKSACLQVYFMNDREAVFTATTFLNSTHHLTVVNLQQYYFKHIYIEDGAEEMAAYPRYYPLTKKNFDLLRKLLSIGHSCTLILKFRKHQNHTLLQQLLSIPSRIEDVELYDQLPSTVKALTPLIERGTLRRLYCHAAKNDSLTVLYKFMTFKGLHSFHLELEDRRPSTYKEVLRKMIDTLLYPKRYNYRLSMYASYRKLFRRITTKKMRQQLNVSFDSLLRNNCLSYGRLHV
uniref:F-box domain-containing protein n=1 Tax=Steinernema glaseri TaxID=37863 RepID=A0A1I8ADF6_9BILA